MSTAILKLSESGELQKIHDKWLSRQACSSEGAKQDVDRLSLKSFWGLFLLCGLACFVALVCYLIKMIYKYMRHSGQSSQSFFSFIKEKENKVVEETDKSRSNRKRRKRISSGRRLDEDESVNVSNASTCLCWRSMKHS
jgi:ionotropic glutamate receptor